MTYDNLPPGTYDLVVRKANLDCQLDLGQVIIEDQPGPAVSAEPNQLECAGISAPATATIIGGTAPLTIAWTGPNDFTSSVADIIMIDPGIYQVQVTDANGCTATDDVLLTHLAVEPGQIIEPIIACPSNDPEPILSLEQASSCNLVENHEFIDEFRAPWQLIETNTGRVEVTKDNSNVLSGEESLYIDVTQESSQIHQLRIHQLIGPFNFGETLSLIHI